MADYSKYSREQLVEEIVKKEESRKKHREKLRNVQELLCNTAKVLEVNKGLKEQLAATEKQQKQSSKELETLQGRVEASDKAKQDAHDAMLQKQRQISSLEQQLQKAHKRADQAELVSKQAEASSAQSATMQRSLQAELDSFRKQLSGLENALQKLEQRQKDHDEDVSSLKARTAQPAAAQHAQRADSLPSTQACSGDTNDDREQVQLRSDVAQLQQQFDVCQEVQRSMQLEMSNWRMAFSGFTYALHPSAGATATSQLMQISPVGAEGSNVMPRQGSRPDPPEVRGVQGSSPPVGVSQVVQDRTPHAGSTAGDGHDVGRHETLGAGSDNLSDAVVTSGSLMQPSLHQPSPGVRLLPSQPPQKPQGEVQTQPPPPPPPLVATLPSLQIPEGELVDSPKAESPKRKTIALQPGALVPRKRKRLASNAGLEQQAAQKRCHTSAQQQQQLQRQAEFSDSGSLQAYLAKFGIHESDATAVEFLELQLGRISHPDEEESANQAATVSSVARDICCALQLRQCPLECILAAFVASFLECAAPHAELQTLQSRPSQSGEGSHPPPAPGPDPTGVLRGLEQQPMATSWCCTAAQQHSSFSWLLHCVAQLDVLLSSPPNKAPAETPPGVSQGPHVPPAPTPKRRGRPPGSKNKKTLQRLQQLGISTAPPAQQSSQQQQSGQSAPHGQSHGQPHGQHSTVEPLKQGTLLNALHQQVLYNLAQACRVKGPGPFETELCCLSAAAAALARLNGKMQAVRVQVLDVLTCFALPTRIKLQCMAAALEVWPEAMTPDPPSTPPHPHSQAPADSQTAAGTGNLIMLCVHATLQSMTQQLSLPQGTVTDSVPLESCHRTEALNRHKTRLRQWNCNQLTHTAAAQIHGMYHKHWRQQQQQQSELQQQLPSTEPSATVAHSDITVTAAADAECAKRMELGAAQCDTPIIAAAAAGHAHCSQTDAGGQSRLGQHVSAPLWSDAAGALLAELDVLSNGDEHRADVRWQQVQQSLLLAVGCLGWHWSFSQVVRDRLACKVQRLLPKAASGDAMSVRLVGHLAQSVKQVLPVVARQIPPDSSDQVTALRAVLQDLHRSAGHHQQKLLQVVVHNAMRQLPGAVAAQDTAAFSPCANQHRPETNPTVQLLPDAQKGTLNTDPSVQSKPDAVNGTLNTDPGQLQDVDMPQAADLPEQKTLPPEATCTVTQPVTEAYEVSRHQALGVEVEQI